MLVQWHCLDPTGTYHMAGVIGRLAMDIAAKADLKIPQDAVEVHPEHGGWRVVARKEL